MMLSKTAWLIVLLGLGLTFAVVIAVSNSYIPGYEDLYDPLAKPVHLSNKVIHSANEFDRISAELVPKHQQLANEIGVLVTVANDLDTLVNQAGNLPVLAHQINQGTAHDIQLANGIPALVGNVIARVNGVNSPLSGLNDTIATDGSMINQIASDIAALKGPLHTIDGQAQQIAGVLSAILNDAKIAGPLGPLLQLLSSLGILNIL